MDFTQFLTPDSLVTFTMTLVVVELWIMFTKELPLIRELPTRLYTFLFSLIHIVISNIGLGLIDTSVLGIYTLLCNGLVVAVVLCGGYDIINEKMKH